MNADREKGEEGREKGGAEAQFRAAERLALAAAELDWNRRGFAPHLRYAAICCVRDMYKLAEELAGARMDELFAPECEQIPPTPLCKRGEREARGDLQPTGPGCTRKEYADGCPAAEPPPSRRAAVTGGLT